MKWIIFFNFLLILGLGLADTSSGSTEEHNSSQETSPFEDVPHKHDVKRRALKRVVRDTFSGMSNQFLPLIEATIISNCKVNGYAEEASKLQNAYDEMKTCMKSKKIFITSKRDYIAHIEECSKESVRLTKTCMADEQKYFPEFILDLAKSVVNFMYDDFDIMRNDLATCLPKFNNYGVQRKYIQCLSDTSVQTHDTNQIPLSKTSFCEKFIPASLCFTSMIKENCDRTTNLDRFREDYINAMKRPCDRKESSY